MSPLAVRVGAGVLALLAVLALRGKGWAYPTFVVLGLLYFPAQTHFHVHVPKCDQLLPTMHVLILPLHALLPPRPVLPLHLAVCPRLPRFHRGVSYLHPPTSRRARALLRHRRTWLRRRKSRRERRSRHVQRSCNAFRRFWDVSGKCHN